MERYAESNARRLEWRAVFYLLIVGKHYGRPWHLCETSDYTVGDNFLKQGWGYLVLSVSSMIPVWGLRSQYGILHRFALQDSGLEYQNILEQYLLGVLALVKMGVGMSICMG
jgi:hypothetical protein